MHIFSIHSFSFARLYGPLRENETRRIRFNDELKHLYKYHTLVSFVKMWRPIRALHAETMEVESIIRRTRQRDISDKKEYGKMDTVAGNRKRYKRHHILRDIKTVAGRH